MLGSVGEPINPEAWLWYYKVVGKERCSIVDTFWQTETGGHVITPLPGATPMKPGSAVCSFLILEKRRLTSLLHSRSHSSVLSLFSSMKPEKKSLARVKVI